MRNVNLNTIYDPSVHINNIPLPAQIDRSCPDELYQDLNDLHYELMTSISDNADRNVLRTFINNVMVENDFNNNEYVSLLKLGLELLSVTNDDVTQIAEIIILDKINTYVNESDYLYNSLNDAELDSLPQLAGISQQIDNIIASANTPQRHRTVGNNRPGGRHPARGNSRPGAIGRNRNNGRNAATARPSGGASRMVNNKQQRPAGVRRSVGTTKGPAANRNVSNNGVNDVDAIEREIHHELRIQEVNKLDSVGTPFPFVTTDGYVSVLVDDEYVLIKEEDVDYETHEVSQRMKRLSSTLFADDTRKVAWGNAMATHEVAISDVTDGKQDVDELFKDNTPIKLTGIQVSRSLPDAIDSVKSNSVALLTTMASKSSDDVGVSLSEAVDTTLFEQGCIITTKLNVTSLDEVQWLEELHETIRNSSGSIETCITALSELTKPDYVGSRLYADVNTILINVVNTRLRSGIGANFDITCITDLNDAIELLNAKFHTVLVDNFKSNLCAALSIAFNLNVMTPVEISISSDDANAPVTHSKVTDVTKYNAMVSGYTNIILAPWASSKMPIKINTTGCTISGKVRCSISGDAFLAAAINLVTRNSGETHIVLSDNVVLTITKSDHGINVPTVRLSN